MTIRSHTKNKILLTGLLICTASLYAPMANAAAIYKIVDEKTGQVTFTDRPQNYEQQAGKQITETHITTDSNSSSSNVSTAANQTTSTAPPTTVATKAPRVNYQLSMIEPSEERAYRRPAQSIVVTLQIKPALQAGDSVSITLDGNEVAQGLSTSISTVDILPGSHVINAVIKNAKGQTLKQISRTVYVIQNTQTLQNNKKIAQQLLAYQRLPWYQKVLLKMRQDGKQPNMQSFTKPIADKPMTLEQPVIK
ncbi:DUF4124 domain-containing protein [Psychrobacter sp. DAB_AL43B]|uniref:DUF4124 domain-containing protein n=1 Tax=Psychrobacter sp. DAB_AL43B TaxID=1028416 RepID=UPI0009C230E6|nr:DUF4124 domain-containing protein [Psychrobacter sp. DAB_AL43B]SLJ84572.1 hypothetical protein DABAL43B_1376 [Psychrobacter sp. DAB_AL43B]